MSNRSIVGPPYLVMEASVIDVNALQPMLSAIMGGAAPADVSKQLSEVSSFRGHTATAEDVANAIAFLASSEAAAITGVNLLIDSGLLTGIGGKPTFSGGTMTAAAAQI